MSAIFGLIHLDDQPAATPDYVFRPRRRYLSFAFCRGEVPPALENERNQIPWHHGGDIVHRLKL